MVLKESHECRVMETADLHNKLVCCLCVFYTQVYECYYLCMYFSMDTYLSIYFMRRTWLFMNSLFFSLGCDNIVGERWIRGQSLTSGNNNAPQLHRRSQRLHTLWIYIRGFSKIKNYSTSTGVCIARSLAIWEKIELPNSAAWFRKAWMYNYEAWRQQIRKIKPHFDVHQKLFHAFRKCTFTRYSITCISHFQQLGTIMG